jgi:hypothetical protein
MFCNEATAIKLATMRSIVFQQMADSIGKLMSYVHGCGGRQEELTSTVMRVISRS